MNIEQANSIPMSAILEKLGYQPSKKSNTGFYFFSPFRKEKTASFHVNTLKNVWYDHGAGCGGNAIDFTCKYLESHNEDHTVIDALRWLNNMMVANQIEFFPKEEIVECDKTLKLHKVFSLQNRNLINYVSSRNISVEHARKYLREVIVINKNTGKKIYALGLLNDENGYELRNKVFKGCIGHKAISIIRGKKQLPDEVHVFEGFMDFLSALHHHKINRFDGDVIILNSLACLSQAFPYIKNYSYKIIYSWFDNDDAGDKATKILKEFIATQEQLVLKPMNELYAKFKDVNEWHMHKPKM